MKNLLGALLWLALLIACMIIAHLKDSADQA